MYWNMVNRDGQKFVEGFGQAPSKIYMTTDFYRKLEHEMYGIQLWFLIKEQSIRGMKIVIDDSVKSYVIVGTKINKESWQNSLFSYNEIVRRLR